MAGHCTGGHIAFRAAFDPRVKAGALWYPTGLHDGKLGRDEDAGSLARAGEIRGRLLTVFGSKDPHTPAEGRDVVRAGLDSAGVDYIWRLYDAEHAFGRDIGARYRPGGDRLRVRGHGGALPRRLRPGVETPQPPDEDPAFGGESSGAVEERGERRGVLAV